MNEQLPEKMVELSENTRAFLAGLRPDEVKTLEAITKQPAEEVGEVFRLVRDLRTVGKYMRWLIIMAVGLFIGSVALYENVLKFLGYLQGGVKP